MSKKLLSLFVAALMLLAVLPAGALAEGVRAVPQVKTQTTVAAWDFETDPLEDGWQFIDADGDGLTWNRSTVITAHSGSYTIASSSYDGGARTPDNWAVTPLTALPEGAITLSYAVRTYSSTYPETYRIYVGTTDDIEAMEPVTDDLTSPANESWRVETVDLSAYAGQNVYIAFRHYNCTDQWRFFIDDVEVLAGEGGGDPTDPPAGGLIAGYYFESEDELEGWSWVGTFDSEWVHSDNNPGGYDYTPYAHEGSGFIMSYSFVDYVGAYQAENWAITPAVELPEGAASLSFYSTQANPDYPESFDVYIGTSAEESEMTLLQSNISPSTGAEDNWTHYEIDLSDYAGQTVYVGFYDHCYDMYEIWLDQVEFFGEGGGEAELIDEIIIDGFTEPVYGEEADYDVTVPQDAPYSIALTSWAREVPGEEVYTMEPGDIFDTVGAYYRMGVMLALPDTYTFAPQDEITVLVNGDATLGFVSSMTPPYGGHSFAMVIIGDFVLEDPDTDPFAIHEVYVNGWGTPAAGVAGIDHMFLTTPDGAPYFIVYGGWRDETDQQQMWSEEHVFIPGHIYTEGCQIWADDGYYFAEDCVFYADGGTEILDLQWCYVDVLDNWICYMNSIEMECVEASELLGDVDLNGEIGTADALLALRYVMGLVDLTDAQLANADADGDGSVTIIDSLLILRAAMELIPGLPYAD